MIQISKTSLLHIFSEQSFSEGNCQFENVQKGTWNGMYSQTHRCLAKYCLSTDHFPCPYIPQEPPHMTNSTPNEVARCGAPSPVKNP